MAAMWKEPSLAIPTSSFITSSQANSLNIDTLEGSATAPNSCTPLI